MTAALLIALFLVALTALAAPHVQNLVDHIGIDDDPSPSPPRTLDDELADATFDFQLWERA